MGWIVVAVHIYIYTPRTRKTDRFPMGSRQPFPTVRTTAIFDPSEKASKAYQSLTRWQDDYRYYGNYTRANCATWRNELAIFRKLRVHQKPNRTWVPEECQLPSWIYIYLERNQILIRSKGSIIDSKSFLNFLKRIFITDKDENGKEWCFSIIKSGWK